MNRTQHQSRRNCGQLAAQFAVGCTIVLALITGVAQAATRDEVDARLAALNPLIEREPTRAGHFTTRGNLHYLLNDLQRAVEDYSTAIKLDTAQDDAWFGRGMALGRMGRIDESVADLDVFIARHPQNSVALTKRGVRNIWRDRLTDAEQDLKRAVAIDPKNAEAHDDLGVVYAKTKRLQEAANHFSAAIRIDRTYQKAYHNLAICYHMVGEHQMALQVVDAGLALAAEHRGSLMLKSTILTALGRAREAQQIAENAEFLPHDNWTERSAVGGAPTPEDTK